MAAGEARARPRSRRRPSRIGATRRSSSSGAYSPSASQKATAAAPRATRLRPGPRRTAAPRPAVGAHGAPRSAPAARGRGRGGVGRAVVDDHARRPGGRAPSRARRATTAPTVASSSWAGRNSTTGRGRRRSGRRGGRAQGGRGRGTRAGRPSRPGAGADRPRPRPSRGRRRSSGRGRRRRRPGRRRRRCPGRTRRRGRGGLVGADAAGGDGHDLGGDRHGGDQRRLARREVDAGPARRSSTPARSRAATRPPRPAGRAASHPRRACPARRTSRAIQTARGDQQQGRRRRPAGSRPAHQLLGHVRARERRRWRRPRGCRRRAGARWTRWPRPTGTRARRTSAHHPQRLAEAQRQQVVARERHVDGRRATGRSVSPGRTRHQRPARSAKASP